MLYGKTAMTTLPCDITITAAHYRSIFEATRNSLLILNYPDGSIVDATPSFLALTNQKIEDLRGKVFWECPCLHPIEQLQELHKALVEAECTIQSGLTLHTYAGTDLDVEVSCQVYRFDGQRMILCNIRDVTRQYTAERALELANDRMVSHLYETIGVLSNVIEARDPYTAGHQARVADLAAKIAEDMELSQETCDGVRVAAMLHDIGKISIPSELLIKSTPLSAAEAEMLKGHVQAGYDILQPLTLPWTIDTYVLQHHERLDGSGYPKGIRGDAILRESRILAVADTVEAMVGERPYRMPLTIETTLADLEEDQGRRYDPTVVASCLKLFREKGYQFPKAKDYRFNSLSERYTP